jgi:hypothetical protein
MPEYLSHHAYSLLNIPICCGSMFALAFSSLVFFRNGICFFGRKQDAAEFEATIAKQNLINCRVSTTRGM